MLISRSQTSIFWCWLVVSMLVGFPAMITGQDEPWQAMDYGPFLSAAIEVTPDNIACKGIAIPLDDDGEHSMLFDSAELRWAAAWQGDFVQLRGIVYDGPHGIWPRIDGDPVWTNPAGPGIAVGAKGTFADPRPVPFGPLPAEIGRFKGMQRDRDGVLLHYTVGKTRIFERAGFTRGEDLKAWKRSIQFIGLDQLLQISLLSLEQGTFFSPSFSGPNSEFILLKRGVPVMAIDVRGGGARIRVSTHEGRVVLIAKPGPEPLGPIHIHIAEADQEHLAAFRAITGRVYLRDPSPLSSVWNKGSEALWPEKITLKGQRGAIFGGDERSDPISRSAGDEKDEWSLADEDGARIHGRDGQQTDEMSASTEESFLVITPETRQPTGLLAGWD
ncbi:MAG: DUF6797 domain-containing protein [Planctomycetota bacterium]